MRVLAVDIAGAFDKVSLRGPLRKAEALGISGELLQWIRSYLADRKLRAVVAGHTSTSQGIGAGVPQGNILVPILFLLDVNDLEDHPPPGVELAVYADDTTIYTVLKTVLVKRAHHAHVAHDRQASAKAQAPHDDIRLPIVARPDARDQFTDERVLLRVDAGFRPQRAEFGFPPGHRPSLELTPSKIENSLNLADLWTKAITRAVLEVLLEIASRRAGLNHRLEKKD